MEEGEGKNKEMKKEEREEEEKAREEEREKSGRKEILWTGVKASSNTCRCINHPR